MLVCGRHCFCFRPYKTSFNRLFIDTSNRTMHAKFIHLAGIWGDFGAILKFNGIHLGVN